MQNKHSHTFLYIAIIIPIFMILFTLLCTLYSKPKLHSHYNFLYTTTYKNNAYACLDSKTYDIHSEQDCKNIQYYEYDFTKNTGQLITLEQARQMKLSLTSPEGYILDDHCYISDFGGFGLYHRTYPNVCLVKDNINMRINIIFPNTVAGSNTYYTFNFIGWIIDRKPSNEEGKI